MIAFFIFIDRETILNVYWRYNGIYLIEDMLVYIIGTYARSGAFAPENTVFCDMNGNVLYQL
jgi:hypothetical protein